MLNTTNLKRRQIGSVVVGTLFLALIFSLSVKPTFANTLLNKYIKVENIQDNYSKFEEASGLNSNDKLIPQNFKWGILAVNTNKERYLRNEEIDVSISVLDNKGYMDCNSKILLEVINLNTGKIQNLSTQSGDIYTTEACYTYEISLQPDYQAKLNLEELGRYQLNIIATNDRGTHKVTKNIYVEDNIMWNIERISPTRIYPLNVYPMEIHITVPQDYKGVVEEELPDDYIIVESKDPLTDFEIVKTPTKQKVIWNVDWKKGETYILKYFYDAPNSSPDFHTIGKIKIDGQYLGGLWQVAVDTTYDDVLLATNGGPTYRLQFNDNITEEISAITTSGSPGAYVTNIIPKDDGNCANFSGQETVLANQADVNDGNTTYRKIASFWVDIDTFGTGTGSTSSNIWEEGGATNWWNAYTSNGDELRIDIGEGGASKGTCYVDSLSTDTLYHVVMQWEASTENMELWLNGVEECTVTTTTSGGLSSHTGDWEIGGQSEAFDYTNVAVGLKFDGQIADYAYWAEPSRLLTQSEIEDIYEAGTNSPGSVVLNNVPFDNEKVGDSTPDFQFTGSDPDGTADIIYHIQIDDDNTFSSNIVDCESDTTCTTGAGSFSNTETGADTNPFNEDELAQFTPTTTLTTGNTYYWRVRAEDSSAGGGSGNYSQWSSIKNFTYVSGTSVPTWFQTEDNQFETNELDNVAVTGSGGVDNSSATAPYIKTESGTMAFDTGDTTKTFDLDTAVDDQASSFILVWGTGPDQDIERVKFKSKFNSDSQIELTRGESGTTAKATWQVVQADTDATTDAFTTQTGEISIASGDTTGNDTITNVTDTDQTTVIVQASCGSSDKTTQVQFRGYLSSTTQVDVARTTSGSACTVRYWVIKWASSINVYNGSTTNVNASDTASIGGTVDLSRSVLFISWDNDTSGLSQHTQRGYLSSTTQLTLSRGTSTGSNNVEWSVVEFPTGVSVQSDNGTSSPTLGTSGTTTDVSISSVAQENTFVVHSQQVTGTGSAITRGETIAYLTSDTTLRFEKLYSGQTSTWTYYVVDFSGWGYTVNTGTMASTTIDYDWADSANDWDELSFTDTETAGDIKYDIQYWTGSAWADTSIVNQDTSPVDISGLTPTTHNEIRLVANFTNSGTPPVLSDWTITWTVSSDPTVTGVSVNGGSTVSLTEGSSTSIDWTSTVTDPDGYSDISNVEGVLYRSGVSGAQTCSISNSNCYSDSTCALSDCSGNSCTATCSVSMEFFAQPTDSSSPYPTEYWRGWVEATDGSSGTGEAWSASGSPDVETLLAMSVTSSISYDPLLPGDDTGTSNETTTITNTGNVILDSEVSGDNFCTDYPTCSGFQIAVGYQEFDTAGFTYGVGTVLSSTPTTVDINLFIPTVRPSNSSTSIYWGLGVPSPKEDGNYSGANTVLAVNGN